MPNHEEYDYIVKGSPDSNMPILLMVSVVLVLIIIGFNINRATKSADERERVSQACRILQTAKFNRPIKAENVEQCMIVHRDKGIQTEDYCMEAIGKIYPTTPKDFGISYNKRIFDIAASKGCGL